MENRVHYKLQKIGKAWIGVAVGVVLFGGLLTVDSANDVIHADTTIQGKQSKIGLPSSNSQVDLKDTGSNAKTATVLEDDSNSSTVAATDSETSLVNQKVAATVPSEAQATGSANSSIDDNINTVVKDTKGVTDVSASAPSTEKLVNSKAVQRQNIAVSSKSEVNRKINITSFLVKEYYQSEDNYYTFRNGMVQIYYNDSNGNRVDLYAGQLNSDGAIKNVSLDNVPTGINSIKIVYVLGNDQLGYIQKSQNINYSFTYNVSVNDTTTDINKEVFASFHGSTDTDSYYYNFTATKIFNFYQDVYNDQVDSVEYARSMIRNLPEMTFEPINIVWEMGYDLGESNGFYRNGHLNSGTPDIVIADRDNVTDTYLKANLSHEWAHWNMYRATGMPGGSYDTDYTYNSNPQVSYKEGWAEFNNIRYIYGYDWPLSNDVLNQTDDRLYGKSTNMTVAGVIYDLFDVNFPDALLQEDDQFDIAGLFNFSSELTQDQGNQLSDGLLYISMIDSKSTTLAGLLQYIEQHFILTVDDYNKFLKVLTINGLDTQGNFTLDGNGDPLS